MTRLLLSVASLSLLAPVRLVLAQQPPPDPAVIEIEDDTAQVRPIYERRAHDYAAFLAEAYGLTPLQAQQLERDLLARVEPMLQNYMQARVAALQVSKALEQAMEKLGPGEQLSEEDMARIEEPLTKVESQEPLGFENVMKFVESQLPAEQAAAGRKRVPELQEAMRQRALDEANARALAEAVYRKQIAMETEEHRRQDGPKTAAGKPMPKPAYVPPRPPIVTPADAPLPPPGARVEARPVSPPGPVANRPEPKPRKEEAKPAAPPPKPAAAPPLDDWDKHVDQVAQRYGFDAAQRTRAQAILKDLRQRADQYRLSHAEDYDRVRRIGDAAERKAEEQRLAEPLNELFAELQERLEQLPTQEQREKSPSK